MRAAEASPIAFPLLIERPDFSLSQAAAQEGKITGMELGESRILTFAFANIASLAYGIFTDYFVKERTEVSQKVVAAGTIATSAIAILFSFRLATLDMTIPISPFWRILGGFFIYMNAVVALRTVVDLFREKAEQPSLPKFAREILRI